MSAGRPRLFVALDLPRPVLDGLGRWARRELGGLAELRLLPAAGMHVTLCFLGWRDEQEIAGLAALTAESASPVAELALGAPAWLPPRRPRALAVDVLDPTHQLAALQLHLSDVLAARAGYRPERRPYRPHVTVARVRPRARIPASRRARLAPPPGEAFADLALVLYRSRLRREGAIYETLSRTAL